MIWKRLASRLRLDGGKRTGVGDMMTGEFDARGDRITGWARTASTVRMTAAEIHVQRRGQIIASCTAKIERDGEYGDRCRFSLPIEGRFKLRELIDESVSVMVWNDRGDRGTLNLDGATQLDLIREHLGVPAVTVLNVDFTRGGNSAEYCGAGWAGAEPDHRWTLDDDSFLHFPAPTEPGLYALRITSGALLRAPGLTRQDMEVTVNGACAGRLSMTSADMQFFELQFDSELLAGAPTTTILFHHPSAARPCDYDDDNKDIRRLAFNVKRATLVRLLKPEVQGE